MTTLATIRTGWDQAARDDAMFNILTDPLRANNGWDPDEFFAHGVSEIDATLRDLASAGVDLKTGRALDFGCGIGRLTQALAAHFKRVDGVDVSPEMVGLAEGHNRHPDRVEYHRNGARLPFADRTFDFVYTMIVLQHMPSRLQRGYVREFLRVLTRDGVAVFQIPEGPDYEHPRQHLSMFSASREQVEGWVTNAGGRLVDVWTSTADQWLSCRYVATRA